MIRRMNIDDEEKWSGQRDSNPRPSAPKADALPGCAIPRQDTVYTELQ